MRELAVVRTMLGRLEIKLQEGETEHVPKEDDRELRLALQRIGDDRLTRLMLDWAVCVRGLTGPMVSRAWKGELAAEADETHRLLLNRLQALERLAGSPVGRLWLWVRAALRGMFRRPFEAGRVTAVTEKHDRGRSR